MKYFFFIRCSRNLIGLEQFIYKNSTFKFAFCIYHIVLKESRMMKNKYFKVCILTSLDDTPIESYTISATEMEILQKMCYCTFCDTTENQVILNVSRYAV